MTVTIRQDGPAHPYHAHWKFCVGSGYAPLALRTDYVRLLRRIHDELGIHYVRFHGIFHDDMKVVTSLKDIRPGRGTERLVEWNFHNIGVAYDNVLSCGMKPFVELSYMPAVLASGSKECSFFYKGNITPPRDDAEWTRFIQEFIRYLLHRYGETEVRTWYFEVWNEPDLPIFFFGTKRDYYHLYEVTARAIKAIDPHLRVGGPATAGSKWVNSFLEFCSARQVPVDFVSTHQYAGDPIGGIDSTADLEEEYPQWPDTQPDYTELLSDLGENELLEGLRRLFPDKSELTELPADGFRTNAAIVRSQAGKLPLLYTEWNANAIFSAPSNDTRKVAAYDLCAALDTENIIDGSSVWCFSDIFEEFHHFPQEFHGGFGMLTSHGIPKPVFHMFRLLGGVGPERLELDPQAETGEIRVAAFRGKNCLQVFLVRNKMRSLPLSPESISVSIICQCPPKSVMLTRIDEQNGNPYRLWKQMGAPSDLTPDEVRRIEEESTPRSEAMPWCWENGQMKLQATLGANDIWYIEAKFTQKGET